MLLVGLVLLAGALWAFIGIADEVREGETATFDERILLAMRNPADRSDPLGPRWVEEVGRDVTALGGVTVLTLVTLSAVGYLLLERKRRTALFVFVAVSGGQLLSTALKIGFHRPRPELVPHETYVYTSSFPSGHSMMAAVTYLTLAALLAHVHRRRRVKTYFMILAILLTLAIGVSRVYLGVHWPTDVAAGWTAGALWALLCWLIGLWLQRRGRIEREWVDIETEELEHSQEDPAPQRRGGS